MQPEPEIRRLVALLRLTLRRTGRVQREVSRSLGYHPNYLGQVFRGRARLSVKLVVRVLDVAGIAPERFFAELFGFGAPPPGPGRPAGQPRPQAGGPLGLDPEAEVARLADALWLKIAETGLSQREVSRRLGGHRDYVNQVLRGNLELKVDHVLSILGALGVPPREFFAEHYGVSRSFGPSFNPGERLPGGVTWGELLAFFDAAAAELRAALRKGGGGAGRRRAGRSHPQRGRKRRTAAAGSSALDLGPRDRLDLGGRRDAAPPELGRLPVPPTLLPPDRP